MKETTASGAGMLAREYPNWATELGPVPGRVVGLLLPAESKWGRSLQWIGEGIVSHPDAYGFQPELHRVYQLYAKGVSPRVISFLMPATGGGGAMSDQAVPLGPGSKNPLGLGKEAHLVELEVNGGTGAARASTFTLTVTGARPVDGKPGYPREVAELMDGARGAFDQFVQRRAAEVSRVLRATATQLPPVPGVEPRESASEGIFPYWDEERRQLWVTFTRRVMRTSSYGVPCLFVYEGMPAQQRSMEIRQAHGVELGQTLALDAKGMLVEVRNFEPAPLVIPSNDPNPPSPEDGKFRSLRICPGSPGARARPDLPFPMMEELAQKPLPPPLPLPVCGNGKMERVAGQSEECDGKDFGAQTCETLGFGGGTLGCTARCALEVAGCDPGGSSAAHPSRTVRDAVEGALAAVSVGHGKIAVVASRGPTLVARSFRGPELTPADGGKEARWDLPRAHGHSLGLPVMTPAEGGFLVAVHAYGSTSQGMVLLHLSVDGQWSGPISTLPGRPVFLVQGAGQALLGLITEKHRVQLEVVRVDGTGKLAGEPVVAIEAAPMSTYAVASAAFTGDGWWVAAGNGGNPFVNVLKYARVGLDGKRVSAHVAPMGTGQLKVVRGPSSTFVVHTGPGGVAAIEIPDGGAGASLPPKVLSGDFFPRLVAARWEGDRLVAWASDVPGRLRRLSLHLRTGAREARTAVAIPNYTPLGADFAEGALVHIFQGAPHRDQHVERGLWLYRGE